MCDEHMKKPVGGLNPPHKGEHSSHSAVPHPPRGAAAQMLYRAVRFYQKYLSPLKMGSTCRFEPVCSAYALEALSVHGAAKGLILTLIRLAKCGPWHPGGFDPIPAKSRWTP